MPTVRDVLSALEDIAPTRYAFSFDKVGLQVGDPDASVGGIVTTLDATGPAVAWAASRDADLIVSHHPLIWEPLAAWRWDTRKGMVLRDLHAHGTSLIAAHTNWDCAQGGVSDALARKLGLIEVRPFGSRATSAAWKLVTFVPHEAAERVIDAVASAGAGRIGAYSRCAFVSEGTGTFFGEAGSQPVIGRPGHVETVHEARVECVVPDGSLGSVEAALLGAHPYETPAYDFVRLRDAGERPVGRIGRLPDPMPFPDFVGMCDGALGTRSLTWGPLGDVKMVAVCGGAGDDDWAAAVQAGADTYLTGEVRHHIAVETASTVRIVQAGHYATEQPGVEALAQALAERFTSTSCSVFAPEPGTCGRPA